MLPNDTIFVGKIKFIIENDKTYFLFLF